MHDNHIWRVRDNSYNKEQYYYDERYDQTEEIKKELKSALEPCRAYDFDVDVEPKDKSEENIDNFYNWD